MRALHALLAGVVDYAGLFPPAGLPMAPVVQRHAAYRRGATAWILGRLVVPVARLEEFEAASAALLPPAADPDDDPATLEPAWRLSALLGADPAEDLRRVAAFNARHAADAGGERVVGRAVVDAVEGRGTTPDALPALAALARPVLARPAASDGAAGDGRRGAPLPLYVEIPLGDDLAAWADAARDAGVRLKARTGGVTPNAFPAPERLLAFLAACHAAGVPGKCTAGLHHALRGDFPLTYEPGCAHGTMFGFVGVLAAAALLAAGHDAAAVAPLLEARDPAALAFDDGGLAWRDPDGAVLRATTADVARARTHGVVAFGSCSFEEPVAELGALGWLPAPPEARTATPDDATSDLPAPAA